MILRIFLFSLTFKYQILFLVHTTVASLYLGNVYKGHGVKLILFGSHIMDLPSDDSYFVPVV